MERVVIINTTPLQILLILSLALTACNRKKKHHPQANVTGANVTGANVSGLTGEVPECSANDCEPPTPPIPPPESPPPTPVCQESPPSYQFAGCQGNQKTPWYRYNTDADVMLEDLDQIVAQLGQDLQA